MRYDQDGGYQWRRRYEPRGGQVVRFVLELFFVAAGVGILFTALRNVFSDGIEVERMAMAKACEEQGPACRAQMTRWERSVIGQTFDIYTPRGTLIVRCRREYFLVGDYGCTLFELPSPEPPPRAIPSAPAPTPSVPVAAKPARSATPR